MLRSRVITEKFLETQDTSKKLFFFFLKNVSKVFIAPFLNVIFNVVNVCVNIRLKVTPMSFCKAIESMMVDPKRFQSEKFCC